MKPHSPTPPHELPIHTGFNAPHRSTPILSILALTAALTVPITTTNAGTFKKISIDGSFADWAGVPRLYSDLQEGNDAIDYKDVYVAHDDQYLYVRFSIHQSGDPFTSRNNLFIDADGDLSTGFKVNGGQIGSELLVQSGSGYQEKNGKFNEGGIDGLGWLSAGNSASTEFEFRISRNATFATDGSPVFTSEQINLLLEAETPTFTPIEFAPDAGQNGIPYEFNGAPPAFPSGQLSLVHLTSSPWYYLTANVSLGTLWTTSEFDPAFARWSQGSGLFGYASQPNIPAIQTPFPTTVTHGYFRTEFQWEYDPSGVVLVLSNFVSDGAAFYLNGTEVKRLRLPSGPLEIETRALSGPSAPGTPERVALPASALVPGLNILAIQCFDQSIPDGHFVFGASLLATDAYPAFFNSPELPADQNIREGDAIELSVDAAGSLPITYQWFKNGSPLDNATTRQLRLVAATSSDAGAYHVEISNGIGGTVRSRTAQITTFAEPIRITNPALPSNLSLLTGQSATFTAEFAGSPPYNIQWFHNNTQIPDATNATLILNNISLSDAGTYYVVIGNRLSATAQSRTATLSVTEDRIAPTVVTAFGSAGALTVTFSEPLDPSSVETLSNYSIKEGLGLQFVLWGGEAAPNVVLLTTAPQTLGTLYTLQFSKIKDRFGNTVTPQSEIQFRSTIQIDGSFEDWAGAVALDTDPQDTSDSSDWNEVYMANDDDYLYVRIVLHNTATWPTSFFYNNFYFNTDDSNLTGNRSYGNVGAEMLVQGGAGYQEKNGGFNEGAIDGLQFAIAPESSSTEFELRISRRATYASDGLPVFTGGGVSLVLEAENSSYEMKDLSPNSGSVDYRFVPATLGRLQITKTTDGVPALSWNGDSILQYRDSLTEGDWQDDPDQSNPHPLSLDNSSRYYRLFKSE